MKRRFLLFLFASALVLLANVTMAQRIVKGVITDADSKESLPGASVLVKGTSVGTVTSFDGSSLWLWRAQKHLCFLTSDTNR
jgi:iron complex outermembrane receptor protein